MRTLIKSLVSAAGYEVRRKIPAGTDQPVGNMRVLLEELAQRGLQPCSILDVGAHRANWSRMAKSVFCEADIFLIEPQAELEAALKAFCTDFPGSKYVLAGAGAANSDLTLTIWQDLAGSSLLPPESSDLKERGRQRTVPVVTLDELLDEGWLSSPQIAKLDVQGYELEVLHGGSKLFGRVEAFIVEVSLFPFLDMMPVFHEVIAYMAQQDYVVYDFAGFLRRPLDGALGQADVCFVKRDGMFRKSHRW